MVEAKEEVEEVDIFQVVGDQGVEVDLVDVEGVTMDAGMSPIRDEVEIDVLEQALRDLLIVRLVMSAKARSFGP